MAESLLTFFLQVSSSVTGVENAVHLFARPVLDLSAEALWTGKKYIKRSCKLAKESQQKKKITDKTLHTEQNRHVKLPKLKWPNWPAQKNGNLHKQVKVLTLGYRYLLFYL